jgi:HEAT repeat protein
MYTAIVTQHWRQVQHLWDEVMLETWRERWLAKPENRSLSPEKLIARALSRPLLDGDAYWDIVQDLHLLGGAEVFEAACRLCASTDPVQRELGADIMAQAYFDDPTMRDRAVLALIALVEWDTNLDVVYSASIGLGHRGDSRAVPALLRWAHCPDAAIRYGVVFGLLGQEDERAIQTLIELSSDADEDVRDWATCGLGTMSQTDTPALRAALVARLNDPHDDTRAEALVGLARRRDERVVPYVLRELESDCVGTLTVEAAKNLADPRLHAALLALQEWWDVDPKLLEGAIAACEVPATEPGGMPPGAAWQPGHSG